MGKNFKVGVFWVEVRYGRGCAWYGDPLVIVNNNVMLCISSFYFSLFTSNARSVVTYVSGRLAGQGSRFAYYLLKRLYMWLLTYYKGTRKCIQSKGPDGPFTAGGLRQAARTCVRSVGWAQPRRWPKGKVVIAIHTRWRASSSRRVRGSIIGPNPSKWPVVGWTCPF